MTESGGFRKKQFDFVADRFKKLQSGEIEYSTSIREYIKEREKTNECLHCGSEKDASPDRLIPRNRGMIRFPGRRPLAQSLSELVTSGACHA